MGQPSWKESLAAAAPALCQLLPCHALPWWGWLCSLRVPLGHGCACGKPWHGQGWHPALHPSPAPADAWTRAIAIAIAIHVPSPSPKPLLAPFPSQENPRLELKCVRWLITSTACSRAAPAHALHPPVLPAAPWVLPASLNWVKVSPAAGISPRLESCPICLDTTMCSGHPVCILHGSILCPVAPPVPHGHLKGVCSPSRASLTLTDHFHPLT